VSRFSNSGTGILPGYLPLRRTCFSRRTFL